MEHSRRRVLQAFGAGGIAFAAAGLVMPSARAEGLAVAQRRGAPDDVAATYLRVLLRHTRWAEQQFDPVARIYPARDFTFAVVLGNAVLLTREGYDAALAGVEREVLHRHTVDTIRHFAASNANTGGTEWGRRLFFDTTFQSYFQLAGRLLWNDLDDATRANLDRIAIGQAIYTAELGTGDDPLSGDWTPNGLSGGHVGDTKLEEMGVYTQALIPGIAWAPGDPRAAAWREWFGNWSRNETGLPAADLANPRVVDGAPISANTAENLYGTFLVENHGSFGPHYQEELWRTSGRNAMHFLLAGQPLPEVLTAQPNGEQLWHTMLLMASDAGEPLMPMVADREHLYGRDVLPLAFRAQVLGDRFAARAEAQLAERLGPYQAYPPTDRVTKFSGEPKYEPEARAEIAISYLLHEWRANHGGPVQPVSQAEFNAHAVGVRDFGEEPGLLAHRTPSAWAAAVTKPGYVKFAWQPHHDNWLFTVSGATPMFLPSTGLEARKRRAATWTKVRDGFDATAAVLEFDDGYAGFASLPSGAAMYATTGLAAGEGVVSVRNLDMPGVPGLNGERTYRTAEGAVTVPAAPGGDRTDDVVFPVVSARHVRMLGEQPDPEYGYSVWSFEVHDGVGGDLARAGTATASSESPGKEAEHAIDGDASTRWAVSTADRPRADSWLAVDLGAAQRFDRVVIRWESAAGRRYRVETSQDGVTWTAVATHPRPSVSTDGGWLDVDGRAGFVVTGSPNPITVTGDEILLSDGSAAPLQVECHPDPRALATAAPRPVSEVAAVRTSVIDGHLVLLNLSGSAVHGTVALPVVAGAVSCYRGDQVITEAGSELTMSLAGAEGRVEAAWFTAHAAGPRLPVGLRATVTDAATLRLTAPAGPQLRLQVQPAGEPPRHVVVPGGRTVTITAHNTRPYPLDDLALGATTFPAEPLPPGMSAPSAAVDGDGGTAWHPGGAGGRMVVDLGAVHRLGAVELTWADDRKPAVTVETSTDGRSYTPLSPTAATTVRLAVAARYVAIRVHDGDADLTTLRIRPATDTAPT